MAFQAGARLGPYEVLSFLGSGGMGEVYRARDTKLNRDVALKILPEAFTEDPDRLARFTREAQTLAALNHPGIAAIHGLEDSGTTHALVMELVEGEDLAQRIAKGPIPIDEALPIAKQIAEALEAAHEQGIIHRDLKPANIKIRPDRTVKLLDFGLARVIERGGPLTPPSANLSNSPTSTGVAAISGIGMLLGTAAYMAPEQAKGRPADKRSDVWAFGCVLYEMLTHRRAFGGSDVPDTLALVLMREPDWTALPANTPLIVRVVLDRCLEKEPRERLRDIGDVRLLLNGAFALSDAVRATVPTMHAQRRIWTLVAVTAVLAAALAGTVVWHSTGFAQVSRTREELSIVLPDQVTLTGAGNSPVAISADGTHVAFAADERLYLRTLGQADVVPIPASELGGNPGFARAPFFSPDGQWIAFWQQGQLRKMPVGGGPSVAVCDLKTVPFGTDWGPDDHILIGGAAGILEVPATGGTPKFVISVPGAVNGSYSPEAMRPQALPGGPWILFVQYPASTADPDTGQVVVQSRATGERRVLLTDVRVARYVSSGHLLYGRGNTLFAQPFDVHRLTFTGNAVQVLDAVATGAATAGAGSLWFATSAVGTLVYVPMRFGSATRTALTRLVLLTREGIASTLLENPGMMTWYPRFSPRDGARIAYALSAGPNQSDAADVWVLDVARRARTRVTSTGNNRFFPIWTQDGKRLTFADSSTPTGRLVWTPADGTGDPDVLIEQGLRRFPTSWSPDGRTLLFHAGGNGTNATGRDIWSLHVDGTTRTATPFVNTKFEEVGGIFSPDGRWVAYVSQKSGRNDVYARPFPGPGSEVTISVDGGSEPVWDPSGHALFYRRTNQMMMVNVSESVDHLGVSAPSPVFEDRYVRDTGDIGGVANYDIAPDGQHFVMVENPAQATNVPQTVHVQVLLNWLDELKGRVPTQ